MNLDRLKTLMNRLTHQTVFAQLRTPIQWALERVRNADSVGHVLSMQDFIALGVLRHLQDMATPRKHVQALLHFDTNEPTPAPLARSTWSDALSSPARLSVLKATIPLLVLKADEVFPDRLADIPGLPPRPVHAIDGTYQHESAHYRRRTPKDGGEDNAKGHALLSFYNLRLDLPESVYVDPV